MQLSVIVPVFNEEAHLAQTANQLADHLDRIVGSGNWEYVVVDNGSTDQSPHVAAEIKVKWPLTRIVSLGKADYGEALWQGLAHSVGLYAYIINVDAWDPEFLRKAWFVRHKHDLILGSKRLRKNELPPYRRLLSWGLNKILTWGFGFIGTDTHGQKLMNRILMEPVRLQTVLRRGQFDTELTLRTQRLGMATAEIPVCLREVRPPRNFMTKKITQNIVDLWKLRRVMRPLRSASVRHETYP